MAELLVNPARSGVYLTRSRIRRIGADMGLRTGIQTRARMLESLFREAGSEGQVDELLSQLDDEVSRWIGRFGDWSRACPPAKNAWKEWSFKSDNLHPNLGADYNQANGQHQANHHPPYHAACCHA